jgi:DNA polymerase III alpha subunit
MLSLLQKVKVDDFKMLTAASSIIRPGVASSGMMSEFILRHHNPGSFEYLHPKMEELLSETYGIMIYQEDVLNVVHGIAGLSYGQADMFRRAMSGKLRSKESLSVHKKAFIDGSIKNCATIEVATELWRMISSFSGYSFCKAHSASYAILSFKEAWLKAHYPADFMCSVLNNYGGFYNHQEYINEAKALDVQIQLPCVNRSDLRHTVEQDHVIRLGFECIKEVSESSKRSILDNRQSGGRYTSFDDFIYRSGVTPEDGRILIAIGACDMFGMQREGMQVLFASIVSGRSKSIARRVSHKMKQHNEQSAMALDDQPTTYDLSHLGQSNAYFNFRLEKKYLGYSVSNHPCDFLPVDPKCVSSQDLYKHVNRKITIQGIVAATKHATTKKGEVMAMLNVADADGMIDVVVWSQQFKHYYSTIVGSEALKITGKVQESYGAYSLIAENIVKIAFN